MEIQKRLASRPISPSEPLRPMPEVTAAPETAPPAAGTVPLAPGMASDAAGVDGVARLLGQKRGGTGQLPWLPAEPTQAPEWEDDAGECPHHPAGDLFDEAATEMPSRNLGAQMIAPSVATQRPRLMPDEEDAAEGPASAIEASIGSQEISSGISSIPTFNNGGQQSTTSSSAAPRFR